MFISGNIDGLGNYKSSLNMNLVNKKEIFSDNSVSYFEMPFYFHANETKLLCYNYYTHYVNCDFFESNQHQRKVWIDFDCYYSNLNNEEFDSPNETIQKTQAYIFRSPIIKMELKYNTLIIYDKMENQSDISFEISNNISLGMLHSKYLNYFH